jgi:DNA polymerase-4
MSHGIDDTRIRRPSMETEKTECEHTFADDTSDKKEVEGILASLVGHMGMQLRQQKKVTRRVGLWLRYSDGGVMVRQATHKSGTSSEFVLLQLALLALKRCWLRRTRIRYCRLVCDRIQRESPQLSLFTLVGNREPESQKIEGAMDHIRRRFGNDSIGVARKYNSAQISPK